LGVKNLVKQILTQKENSLYKRRLKKKQISYQHWLKNRETLWRAENEKILREAGAEGRKTDFVLLCAGEGKLSEYAQESIECYFIKHPEVQLLYGDEDIMGGKPEPWFKPDWSPDLLDSRFYFGSIVAVRRELFERMEGCFEKTEGRCLWREERGRACPAADWRCVNDFENYAWWIFRCVDAAGGYEKGTRAVGHIPQILFHNDNRRSLEKYQGQTACMQARSRNLLITFYEAYAGDSPVVSVIIPSRDHPDILERCIESVRKTLCFHAELLVVDNGSTEENRKKTEKLIHNSTNEHLTCSYLYRPMEFNFSRMCNLGAEEARGKFFLFLNDDVELEEMDCIGRMAAMAARNYTGAVGMKLYYPESVRIQHAGITNLPMGPVHKLQFQKDNNSYYYEVNRGLRNCLAVTAACLMVERAKFLEAGGFAESLKVAFNDVDFCFRLYELGYQNVCINDSFAYHHESLSRGDDETPEKLERLWAERDRLYEEHPGLRGTDPYFSDNLSREGLDVMIRPAYETAGNSVQQILEKPKEAELSEYRQDNCLSVRVEAVDSHEGEILGWSVVLGDNNACYFRKLLLKRVEAEKAESKMVYEISLKGGHRPDLQENMPDQMNVALGGFHVRLKPDLLPPGRYRIGAAASSRVSRLKLMNWTNRFLDISG